MRRTSPDIDRRQDHAEPISPTRPRPLPRRRWWPWDEAAHHVRFERKFTLPASTEAALCVTASGATEVWIYAVLGELGAAPPRPLTVQQSPGLQAIWRTSSGDINDIPTYTLWWIVGLADYVRYTGDVTLLQELAPELTATLAHVAARVEHDGLWRAHEGWDLVDWSPLSVEERMQFSYLLAYQALVLGQRLLAQIGGDTTPYTTGRLSISTGPRAPCQPLAGTFMFRSVARARNSPPPLAILPRSRLTSRKLSEQNGKSNSSRASTIQPARRPGELTTRA